jgi:DNA gyrase inhibitor GyrI
MNWDILITGKKEMVYLIAAVIAATLVYCGWKFTARSAYESAEYTVSESNNPFEIREYPDLMLATTEMRSESQGNDGSFMRLFRYIDGGNDEEQKVAMTTPVFMESEKAGAQGQMGFVIPKNITGDHIPEPSDENVQIRKRAGGRFAVIRFSGRMKSEAKTQAEARLRQWMKENELVGDGDVEFAGYDPPWTPGPFRRNEILIRLK